MIEYERTLTSKAIMEEKIRLNEKITNFRYFGLLSQAKFLYFFIMGNFGVTTRPVEYGKHMPVLESVEKKFG